VRSFFGENMRLLVDAHQDLAWNMLTFGRDYSLSAAETRKGESAKPIIAEMNGDSLLGWQEYQDGHVGLIFSTLFAAPKRHAMGDWDKQYFSDPESAHRLYRNQLETYFRFVDQHPDKFRMVLTQKDLDETLTEWRSALPEGVVGRRVGLVPLMECAEAVRHPDELAEWWEMGVHLIGPAWAGTRFCGGTREPGPLTKEGHALLDAMSDIGFTLDLSHMAWEAALESLDRYDGPIVASHSNALSMIKGTESNRFITDEIIEGIIERDGVIGIVPFNRFLVAGWQNSNPRSLVPLELVAAQIDYICQKAGDASHVGFGTDFDGGFGLQHVPPEIDTIVDLHKVADLLQNRGYTESDIDLIFAGNWIRHLSQHLPG